MTRYSPNHPYRPDDAETQSERNRSSQIKKLEEKMWSIFNQHLINKRHIETYNAYERRWKHLVNYNGEPPTVK